MIDECVLPLPVAYSQHGTLLVPKGSSVMKPSRYERLLFAVALAGWTVCGLLFLYAGISRFAIFRGGSGTDQYQTMSLLRQLQIPTAVLTIALFLLNLVRNKLQNRTSFFLLLSCFPIPISVYAYSMPDYLLGPYITACLSFFSVPILLRIIFSDLICSGALTGKAQNLRKKLRTILFGICSVLSTLMTVCLCLSACSGHVLAKSLSFLAFSLPYPCVLQLSVLFDAAEGRLNEPERCCLDLLSAVLPGYLIARCFYPDHANSFASIGLYSLVAVFVILLFLQQRRRKQSKTICLPDMKPCREKCSEESIDSVENKNRTDDDEENKIL